MQQREIEELMQRIARESGNPDAARAAGRMREALRTPEGQQAAQRVLEGHGRALERAARMAQAGDLEGAKQSVQQIKYMSLEQLCSVLKSQVPIKQLDWSSKNPNAMNFLI